MGFFDVTILSMFFITALSNSAYALIAPFLPFEFEKKQISQTIIGYVFSIYSVAVIITSPLIGKMIKRCGRRFLIKMGVVLMGVSFIFFGLLSFVEDKVLYISLAFAIRLIQGFASSSIQTTCYSICTNFYPEKKEALVGYIEAVTGIGLILGPIIGSVLYSFGGIAFTFFTFGGIFLFSAFFISSIFPKRLDKDNTPLVDQQMHSYTLMSHEDHTHNPHKIQIGYLTLLGHTRYTLAAIAGALGYFLYGYMEPILAFRLADFQLTQLQIGLFFTILPVFYIPMSIVVQYTPKGVEKRAILILSCFLSFFVNICVGPSQLFGFSNSLWIMVVGQALHGIVDPFLLVPSLPEMIESVIDIYPDDEFLINDLSSGIFNCFLGLGQISGPLYGSLMTQYSGFRLTADYVALLMMAFGVVYFFLGEGWSAFKNSKFTNYGHPIHFGENMIVQTPILNRSRLLSNYSHDIYLHGNRKYSVFSTSQINFHGPPNRSALLN